MVFSFLNPPVAPAGRTNCVYLEDEKMNMNQCKVGQKVYFGRRRGEKTLGTIVKVNRTRCKVRQDEARGTMKAHAVGTVWTVPASLMTLVDGEHHIHKVEAPTTATRNEADIMRDISDIYGALSPENLYCDGELSRSEARRKAVTLRSQLRKCFSELGRDVDEHEAWLFVRDLPSESWEQAMERRNRRNRLHTPQHDTSSTTASRLGLPSDVVGRKVRLGRSTYTVIGFKTRNTKYPVLATNQNGKGYKLSVQDVMQGL